MNQFQDGTLLLLPCLFFFFLGCISCFAGVSGGGKDILITLRYDNDGTSLKKAAKFVKIQTGYTLIIDRKFENKIVHGFFNNIDVDVFLRRVLKKVSYIVERDDEKKIIYVRSFGASDFVVAEQENSIVKNENFASLNPVKSKLFFEEQIQRGYKKYEKHGIDSVTGLSSQDLKDKYNKAVQAEKEKYLKNGIDPVSGMPTEAYIHFKEKGKNMYQNKGIDPVTGLPLAELKEKFESAVKQGKILYENRGIDPVTGLYSN